MSSTQFGNKPQNNNFEQSNPAAPPPAQWNVPPGVPGYNLSPNPQMWHATNALPWNSSAPQQWNNPMITVIPQMIQSTTFHQEFLKGKPKILGIILILVGIAHIGMGIGLFYTLSLAPVYSGIPFWGAIFNIIAGSLSVAAVSKPSMCLIKGSLSLSIIISISSVIGLILNIVDYFTRYCYDPYSYYYYICYDYGGDVLRGFFILTYLLQFSISVSLSVFGCRAQKHSNPLPAQVFVLQNSAAVLQPITVPGSYTTYPTYPPQQPPPYTAQNGIGGVPTV
ncbi:membrane-spanning 4-domains subfamily A member 8-like [Aquarana catesbeiana]|uniref:membrane-spanning 4-domains subfamily A member 8-like n=1 Tax=Aquarana catesbeiana TaxID=8400 RepID=UPI003CC970AE